jgi:hypothetical protein
MDTGSIGVSTEAIAGCGSEIAPGDNGAPTDSRIVSISRGRCTGGRGGGTTGAMGGSATAVSLNGGGPEKGSGMTARRDNGVPQNAQAGSVKLTGLPQDGQIPLLSSMAYLQSGFQCQ